MKRVFIPFASLLAVCCTSTPESHVNPLIGTEVWQGGIAIAGHEEASGYTFPGVTEPFGMTEWTAHTLPDKKPETLHHRVPYWYAHEYISGFLGTHYPSGAVMFDYGALELMPLTGTLKVRPEERSSSFRHEAERARPSLYEVHLDDYDIQVRMAATKASAVFDFVYPACDSAYVVVDAMPSLFTAGAPAEISISPERREISGKSAMTARAYRETGFFVVRFDKEFEDFGTFNQNMDYPEVIENRYLFTEKDGKLVNGLRGVYTHQSDWLGAVRSERIDPVVDFDWDWYRPADDIDVKDYQVTWTGKLKAPETGSYLLGLQSDDGARLWLDGELVIDDWGPHGYSMTPTQKNVMLEAGRMYDIRVDYYQHEWNSRVKLSWIRPGDAARKLLLRGNKRLACSTKCGAYVRFEAAAGETVRAWVGTSFISEEDARANLEREIAGAGVDKIARATAAKWNEALACIELPGATEQQKQVFYTALYHAFLLPRSISENGRYRSPYNGQVCEGESFTDYSTWDTFRALHPLLVLLKPDLASHMVTGLLNGYDEGGWMPKWPNPGYTNCMMGTHSDAIIADAYVKGVRGFDEQKAARAMLKNANVKGNHIAWGRLGIEDYNSLGYVPVDHYRESVARTMEFAYDDWCLARFFEAKGDTEKAREYDLRSQRFKNVLDAETKLVRARRSDGTWAAPSDYNISVWSGFNETGALNYRKNYTLFAPHDVPALIEFMGGNDAMAAFLDDIFDNGIYYVGDEFSMHAPYMYNLCGMPWKTQRRVYDIVNTYYLPQPSGLPGNDDCGQLSAWYLFSAMGFYPMCPGSTEYQLGIPCLPEIILHLPNGRDFRIVCENFGSGNCYVQSVTLNGKALERPAIEHADILRGGELRFSVADTPSETCFTSKSR